MLLRFETDICCLILTWYNSVESEVEDLDNLGFVRKTMINERIQKYVNDHSFCSEYLFKDWEAFLDFIYEEGGRVSSILWWEHCKKNFQHGYGGYSDPDDGEWMYSETWFHEDGFEEKSLADIKAYIHETREHGLILGDKYITHDLVPSFYLAD